MSSYFMDMINDIWTSKNIYKWQKPKETRLKDNMTDVKHLQDDVKLRITRLFCEWINSLVIF